MRRFNHVLLMGFASLVAAAGCGVSNNDTPASDLPHETAAIIRWLPVDTQSLIVYQEPFRFVPEDEIREPSVASGVGTLPSFFDLRLISDGKAFEKLIGEQCNRLVIGARSFRPRHYGPAGFKVSGAYVLIMDKPLPKDTWAAFTAGATTRTIDGVEVSEHIVKDFKFGEEDTVLLALIDDHKLVVASDQVYLKDLLSRVENPPEQSLLNNGWKEWTHVDVTAPIWGLRHYSKDTAADDPTSAFHGVLDPAHDGDRAVIVSDWNVPDRDASGFTFSFRRDKDDHDKVTCVVFYLSTNPDATEIASAAWKSIPPPAPVAPTVKRIDRSTVEVTFADDVIKQHGGTAFFLLVFGRFGFGIT